MSYTTRILSGKYAAREAASLIEEGECVAIPTETVYGLAAMASDSEAVKKIFDAKRRPSDHPLIIHISNASEAENWARDIPPDYFTLANACWPGPLTMVLKKAAHLPDRITSGLDTVALRIPSHPLFLEVLRIVKGALVAPSANMHKELSAVCADQVFTSMNGRISAVVDGGRCSVGLESTIIDLTGDLPTILRSGPITGREIESLIGKKVLSPVKHTVKISGNMKAHYQPKAKLNIQHCDDILFRLSRPGTGRDFFLIQTEDAFDIIQTQTHSDVRVFRMPLNARDYARDLYFTLAQADREGAERIFVESPPQTEDWLAVNDRLIRAQG